MTSVSNNLSSSTSSQYATFSPLSEKLQPLLDKIKSFKPGYFSNSEKKLTSTLKEIQPIDVKQVLEHFFHELVAEDRDEDLIKTIDKFAAILPLEKISESRDCDLLQNAVSQFKLAKLYLKTSHNSFSPSLQTQLSTIFDGLISFIESIIAVFGVMNLFKPADSELHANFKSHQIMMLFSFFGMITQLVIPLLGAAIAGKVIGGILLSIAALSIIWPSIKPMPSHLPGNAENWTKEVQQKGFEMDGRKEILNQIASIIEVGRHVILVGPSRMGKSLTAKAFARAIERGDYPKLKGKKVFRINMGDLVDQSPSFMGGGNPILNDISNAMGRHREDIILVFDEIHMACKDHSKIADKLKTFLDEGGEFPHVIGITTDEEYDQHIVANHAFSRRFDKVEISNMSEAETLKILSDRVIRANTLVEDGVIEYIYKKSLDISSNAPQPYEAIKLLEYCIQATENVPKSEIEGKIINLSNQIRSLSSQLIASRSNDKDRSMETIEDLRNEKRELKKKKIEEQKTLGKLVNAKAQLNRATQSAYLTAFKIDGVVQTTMSTEKAAQLKRFLLLKQILIPVLLDYIKKQSGQLKIQTVIDQNLVDRIVSEKLGNRS